jgi:hypothetical protein
MTIRRASRPARLLLGAALACLGLAFTAQAAHATYGKLQIVKVNQGGNPTDSFAFHPTVTPAASDFSLQGGQTSSAMQVECNIDRPANPGECTSKWGGVAQGVTEAATPGYTLTDVTCRSTQGTSSFASEPTDTSPVKPASEVAVALGAGSVSVKIHWYEWVKCWFTNTPTAASPPPSGSPPPAPQPAAPPPSAVSASGQSSPAPQSQVSPERVTPGRAQLSGTSGCARSNIVQAAVTGRHIVKVTFYVDNRKVKTLTSANSKGRWALKVAMRKVAYGKHRITARVEFAKRSGTSAKTLRLSFSRCGASSVTPNFTG